MDDKDKPEGGTKALPSCPVMDEPIDISVSTPGDQGPVYFCCADCVKKYSEKPDKYAAKVAEQRKALAHRPKVQVSCPLDGQPVDSKVSIEEKGQKVYFCCDKCPAEYQKDPAKYAAKLANAYTYQTQCPVMKEEIDPAVYTDLPTEQRVYFCCKKCVGKFKESPEKYVAALETQGMYVDPEKAKGK
jgi:YHS domain-containing protein